MDAITFRTNLKRIRSEKGLTRKDLETEMGARMSTIARWERGGGVPSLEYQEGLIKAFGEEYREALTCRQPKPRELQQRIAYLEASLKNIENIVKKAITAQELACYPWDEEIFTVINKCFK